MVVEVARFSGENDRRRFYGDNDDRRPPSREYEMGDGWRLLSDPLAFYALRWVEDTHEIRALRRPRPRPPAPKDEDSVITSSWPEPVMNMDFGAQVLGWADSVEVLEQALAGWETLMFEDDSLQWVRQRLADAAAETERRRSAGLR